MPGARGGNRSEPLRNGHRPAPDREDPVLPVSRQINAALVVIVISARSVAFRAHSQRSLMKPSLESSGRILSARRISPSLFAVALAGLLLAACGSSSTTGSTSTTAGGARVGVRLP